MAQTLSFDELLYDKTYTCPLCGQSFQIKAIRSGKNKLVSVDDDLYAHYEQIDPLLCDIAACPHCGYSVLTKTIGPLSPKQKAWLKEKFNQSLPPTHYEAYPTLADAIHKHKMALLACIIRKSKLSEQAYLSLHLAFLYRKAEDPKSASTFFSRAYAGFSEAYLAEGLPIMNMDEGTILYLLAILAYKLDLISESKQHLSKVLSSTLTSSRIKDRALTLKQKLITL